MSLTVEELRKLTLAQCRPKEVQEKLKAALMKKQPPSFTGRCPVCGKDGVVVNYLLCLDYLTPCLLDAGPEEIFRPQADCTACGRARIMRAFRLLQAQAGVKENWANTTFDTWKPGLPSQEIAFQSAREFASNPTKKALALGGSFGVGKSHLVHAAANALLWRDAANTITPEEIAGCNVDGHRVTPFVSIFYVPDLLLKIREAQTIKYDPEVERERSLRDRLIMAPVVILDDMGQMKLERPPEIGFLTDLITSRLDRNRPILMTGNFDPKGFTQYIGDRATSRFNTVGSFVHIVAPDFRQTTRKDQLHA